jgi:hypothetical protein
MTAEGGRLGICTQDRTPHVAERSCNNWHPAAQPSESEREGARPIRCPDCHHTDHHDSVGCTYKGPPFGNPCRCTRKYWPTTKPDETYMDHPFAPAPPSPPSTGQSREQRLEEALDAVRPSCRARGCWCPAGWDTSQAHSVACEIARRALESKP